MSLLLDTHVMLCWPTDDETLAEEVKDRLDHEHNVSISPATIWEVAIKQSLGKLQPVEGVWVERSSPTGEHRRSRCAGNPEPPTANAPCASRGRSAVEVPGIEPGSFVALLGLLRAQLAVPLLGPTDHASESV